jgi:hypothetical protein
MALALWYQVWWVSQSSECTRSAHVNATVGVWDGDWEMKTKLLTHGPPITGKAMFQISKKSDLSRTADPLAGRHPKTCRPTTGSLLPGLPVRLSVSPNDLLECTAPLFEVPEHAIACACRRKQNHIAGHCRSARRINRLFKSCSPNNPLAALIPPCVQPPRKPSLSYRQ